jgi:hypothetical protein
MTLQCRHSLAIPPARPMRNANSTSARPAISTPLATPDWIVERRRLQSSSLNAGIGFSDRPASLAKWTVEASRFQSSSDSGGISPVSTGTVAARYSDAGQIEWRSQLEPCAISSARTGALHFVPANFGATVDVGRSGKIDRQCATSAASGSCSRFHSSCRSLYAASLRWSACPRAVRASHPSAIGTTPTSGQSSVPSGNGTADTRSLDARRSYAPRPSAPSGLRRTHPPRKNTGSTRSERRKSRSRSLRGILWSPISDNQIRARNTARSEAAYASTSTIECGTPCPASTKSASQNGSRCVTQPAPRTSRSGVRGGTPSTGTSSPASVKTRRPLWFRTQSPAQGKTRSSSSGGAS